MTAINSTATTLQHIVDAFSAASIILSFHRDGAGAGFYSVSLLGVQIPTDAGPDRGHLYTHVDALELDAVIAGLNKDLARRQTELTVRSAYLNIHAA